ncbi:TIGR00255 family protein [Desulfotomaculum arcticum]|uniref:TIGR00255 family protein n=1 Tax=Desulfotruncus arcticus DSM 17038 TaxID=1121424 RepID=A0A1I2R6B0_9FIRM|nr:TIGR00255 family protein [Desulfotomaculum arcticum] [Desulfotruncus arcticus DSM 17038]
MFVTGVNTKVNTLCALGGEKLIKSMTGFGRGEINNEKVKINVEMKSVNHRYCEIVLRMPRLLNVLEDRIKRVIQKRIARGRVEVYIKIELCGENRALVRADGELAASYLKALTELNSKFNLPGEIKISKLLQLPGVFNLEEPEEDVELWWPTLESTLHHALDGLMQMRIKEGKQLSEDVVVRAKRISEMVAQIERRSPVVVEEYRERLKQRLKDILEQGNLDPSRLEGEVVIFAERSSITEEIVRLGSHLTQLAGCLNSDESVGRKMDFLLQEMNREINTIASKASDLTINSLVVEVKSELEKIREQIQNME